MQNYYQLMGIEPDHPQTIIPQAFRNKIKQIHPDKCSHQHQTQLQDNKDATIALYQAYKILNDPETRAVYDEQLKTIGRAEETSSSRYFQETVLVKEGGKWFVECEQCQGRTEIGGEDLGKIQQGERDCFVKCWHCNLSLSLFVEEEEE